MKKIFTTLLFTSMVIFAFAQGSITGMVVDSETGEGLIGASVLIKGTTTGVVTDFDGAFTLNEVKEGAQTIVISYTGFNPIEQNVTVTSGTTDLGRIAMSSNTVGLDEIMVLASAAVDRKTPVAVSTIKGEQIEAMVGNQEFIEVLRNTPSIYVTKEGGGFGDSRINVRGFDQRNTAVMINGIPVNDMENGWVYWSNWAGLSDVTSQMQVQRGLGASKLAVPSVGGSINIITNAAEMTRGGAVSISMGNDGYQKYGLALNSGLGEKGWAFSLQGTHTRGDGYVDGTMFRAYSYFLSISKVINDKHTLTFTGLGAPQWHNQRLTAGSFDNLTLRTFVDPDNENDPNTNKGIKYNFSAGKLNGEEYSWRKNFFHKPHINLNHYWNISDKTSLKTSVYVSLGRGGGTGPRGRINVDTTGARIFDSFSGFGQGIHDREGMVRFDDIVAYNKGATIPDFGDPNTDPGTTTSSGDGFIRRASMNYHDWYGIISTLDTRLSSNFNLTGGIDARYYKGEHFRRVEDLLGNTSYLARGDINNPMNLITKASPADFGNFYDNSYKDRTNVIDYYNDGLVSWVGLFAQLEYTKDKLSAFLSLSGSNQGFKRVDYFTYLDSDPLQSTDWQNYMGGTVKVGANYNINAQHNVYANVGYFSRQPIFDNVFINFVNDVDETVKNQTVTAFEAGYGFRANNLNLNFNAYYTEWGNRQFSKDVDLPNSQDGLATFRDVSQRHIGVELDFVWKVIDPLSITGMLSVGNWEYGNDFVGDVTNIDTNEPVGKQTLYLSGQKVGDAAQTTASIGANWEIIKGLNLYADYYLADNLYANWDIAEGQFDSPGGKIQKLPSYSLMNAGVSYRVGFNGMGLTFRVNVNNLLDEIYISEMDTNNEVLYDNKGLFGFGRTWNAGVKFTF